METVPMAVRLPRRWDVVAVQQHRFISPEMVLKRFSSLQAAVVEPMQVIPVETEEPVVEITQVPV